MGWRCAGQCPEPQPRGWQVGGVAQYRIQKEGKSRRSTSVVLMFAPYMLWAHQSSLLCDWSLSSIPLPCSCHPRPLERCVCTIFPAHFSCRGSIQEMDLCFPCKIPPFSKFTQAHLQAKGAFATPFLSWLSLACQQMQQAERAPFPVLWRR